MGERVAGEFGGRTDSGRRTPPGARRWSGRALALGAAAVVAAATAVAWRTGGAHAVTRPAVRETVVVMKFWKATVADVPTIAVTNLPADAVAYEGDTVVFTVKNESPLPEGFSIDTLGIKEVIQPKQTKRIRVANVRAGAHVIYCQLHPMSVHYPGNLLVLPRR